MDETASLPSYQNPPLVEVAMAGQFKTQHPLNAGHLGAFWSLIRQKFPSVQTSAPIMSRGREFDPAAQWTPPSIQLALSSRPDCRLQMTSPADDTWMWQIQSDRLVVNWRKRSADYPRYTSTMEEFRRAWQQWTAFLETMGRSTAPVGWELTYVNEIPSGPDELWESPSQLPEVLPGLFGGAFRAESGLTLAGLHGEWVWTHEDPPARLVVNPAPAKREKRDVLILKLTARGPVAQEGQPSESIVEGEEGLQLLESGLNLGHRLIVNTFDALGSERAKGEDHWGRK